MSSTEEEAEDCVCGNLRQLEQARMFVSSLHYCVEFAFTTGGGDRLTPLKLDVRVAMDWQHNNSPGLA